ncbi:MAG: hydroxyacylglutathione hydrolase [Rhodospirillales bacterium]|nr:hydroxyacylglutathione hydrolase [Rhodospirillales bacterium]
MIEPTPVPILSDNYAWLLREPQSNLLAIVDPAEATPVIAAIEAAIRDRGGELALILLTHHHADHVAGTDEVRARFGVPVVGAKADAHRLPRLDRSVGEGSEVDFGAATARVWETPGHTQGHISYVFTEAAEGVLLCGDTLFSLGCGRLLEGTAEQMFASLQRFAALPPATLVCCGHEYTASNARFARHADPHNADLLAYEQKVLAWRAAGRPSLPSRLADELACNPFLRAADVATLADLRARKDTFR